MNTKPIRTVRTLIDNVAAVLIATLTEHQQADILNALLCVGDADLTDDQADAGDMLFHALMNLVPPNVVTLAQEGN